MLKSSEPIWASQCFVIQGYYIRNSVMDSGYRAGFSVLGDYDMVFFSGYCIILGLWFQTGRPVISCVITKHMFGLALSYLIPSGLRVLIYNQVGREWDCRQYWWLCSSLSNLFASGTFVQFDMACQVSLPCFVLHTPEFHVFRAWHILKLEQREGDR